MVAAAATTAAALPTLTCGRRIRGVARGAPPPSENTSLPPPSRARRRGLHPLHSPTLPLPQGKAKRAAEKAAEAEREGRHRERIAEAELKVHAEIEAKREKRRKEEKALSEELKAIKIKNQFLGADKEAVERKKWASQQAGAQREIEKIQREKQEAAVAKAQIARKEEAQRLLNLRREREEPEEAAPRHLMAARPRRAGPHGPRSAPASRCFGCRQRHSSRPRDASMFPDA